MQMHRWFNQSQPRSLQNAVMLIYLNAGIALFFGLLGGGVFAGVSLLTIVGVAGGYGIANDKKWGYYLSLVCAILPLAFAALLLLGGDTGVILSVIFEIVLVVLLVQETSRGYVRLWFK
jgi:hypothetical protein